MSDKRRWCVGAEVIDGRVHFRVWAPVHKRVSVVIESDGREYELAAEPHGYFAGFVDSARAGTLYRLRAGHDLIPDPASRFQPDGPHGPSQVVDSTTFRWTDTAWRGRALRGLIISEIHIGTFTAEGTFRAAIEHLRDLADAGINAVEVMPVSEFPGQFGWGYDGVDIWAPTRLYGQPDDFRAFVDAAHDIGIAVFLDVVYNHLGPDGCYIPKLAPQFFTKRYKNEWGEALNFDSDESQPVRDFIAGNAAYWISEFHLDGLRIDATQSIFDESKPHILQTIAERTHAAAGERRILLIAENEPQDVCILNEYGLDAMWNDDWHHAARVAATRRREAYYTDYLGSPQEFLSMAWSGFLYQGQYYEWQKKRRGTPSGGIDPHHFILYLQNHDQIANTGHGLRLDDLTSPAMLRALTALLLLSPQTPMLFQGQEFAASARFLYFADHHRELAESVRKGRLEFLSQFSSLSSPKVQATLAVPHELSTFESCKIDWNDRKKNSGALDLHRDLIALRFRDRFHEEPLVDSAVLSDRAFALRWRERLLLINLGERTMLSPMSQPLLAPPPDRTWQLIWASEDPKYGGDGTPKIDVDRTWTLPAESALVFAAIAD